MIRHFRWVKQGVVSAPGTGDILLGSRVNSYLALSDISDVVDGSQIYYTVEDGQDREYGVGTYVAATNSLVRTFVYAVMQSGKLSRYPSNGLDLSINALVSSEPQAKPFRGVLLRLSANLTFPYNAWVQTPWTKVVYDTDGFFTGSGIIIPEGVNLIRTQVGLQGNTTTIRLGFYTQINGVKDRGAVQAGGPNGSSIISASGPAIPVVPGDVVTTYSSAGEYSSCYLIGSSLANFFSIEVVG